MGGRRFYNCFFYSGGKEESKRYNCHISSSFNNSKSTRVQQSTSNPRVQSTLQISQPSQSPEPPPRYNRFTSQGEESGSPLPMKRGFLDHSPLRKGLVEGSPSLSRR